MSTNPFDEINSRLERIERLLEKKEIPAPVELPDRIDFQEARYVIGGEKTPVSKAWLYAQTSKGTVPCSKAGGKLVFSRAKLLAIRDIRTVDKFLENDNIHNRIAESAEKKFQK